MLGALDSMNNINHDPHVPFNSRVVLKQVFLCSEKFLFHVGIHVIFHISHLLIHSDLIWEKSLNLNRHLKGIQCRSLLGKDNALSLGL